MPTTSCRCKHRHVISLFHHVNILARFDHVEIVTVAVSTFYTQETSVSYYPKKLTTLLNFRVDLVLESISHKFFTYVTYLPCGMTTH